MTICVKPLTRRLSYIEGEPIMNDFTPTIPAEETIQAIEELFKLQREVWRLASHVASLRKAKQASDDARNDEAHYYLNWIAESAEHHPNIRSIAEALVDPIAAAREKASMAAEFVDHSRARFVALRNKLGAAETAGKPKAIAAALSELETFAARVDCQYSVDISEVVRAEAESFLSARQQAASVEKAP
jgi:hypothetical protein